MTHLSDLDWHKRYTQQASWTSQLRQHLFERTGLLENQRVLEIGCGTGAVLGDFSNTSLPTYGLDINLHNLRVAKKYNLKAGFIQGDAHYLPFPNDLFGIVFCHFLLLWVKNPSSVVNEMYRITQVGGAVIAMAEPDYGGRIDHPPALEQLGFLQSKSLEKQGADPFMGRKLAAVFSQADLADIEIGVVGGQWKVPAKQQEWEAEWEILEDDLRELVTKQELIQYQEINHQAWLSGQRILFVPTFYAWGKKAS